MVQNKPSISLTISLPNGSTKVLEFNTDEPIMMGSGASAHVQLTGDDVSSLHAMVKPVDDKVFVVDLGSDEGTKLNGKEISGETAMDDGDSISIGKNRVVVHFGGAMLAPTVPIRRAAGHDPAHDDAHDHSVVQTSATMTTKTTPAPVITTPAPVLEVAAPEAAAKEASKAVKKKPQTAESPMTTPKGPSKQRDVATQIVRNRAAIDGAPAAQLSAELTTEEKPSNKGNVDVTVLWGGTVMGVERIAGSGTVTIGESASSRVRVSHQSIPAPTYPLVELDAAGASVNVAKGMELFIDKQPSQATGKVKLEMGQRITVRVGPISFEIQYSKRYLPIDLGLFQTLDFFYTKVFAVAMIVQIGLILAILFTPNLGGGDDDDLFKNQQEYTKLILTAQEKKKEKPDLSGKKAAKHKDDEGVFGKKDKPKEDKLASKKGAPTVDKDKREEDRKVAMDALAALGLKGPEGAVSNVFGPGGLGTGINNALGGLKGAAMGDAGGAGGLGSRGTGAGGGGTGLGIGGLGSGTGRGSGGNGNVDLGGRGKGTTKIIPGKIIMEGGLSREEIQRVINRVMSQIKYCYEKELNKDPNLEGKLVSFWVINGSGDVGSAQMSQNTFSGPSAQPVEQCVLRILQRLKFPSPKGGGQVSVTYPFVFSASGGG